jgi:hypothetical protein
MGVFIMGDIYEDSSTYKRIILNLSILILGCFIIPPVPEKGSTRKTLTRRVTYKYIKVVKRIIKVDKKIIYYYN